MSITHYLTIQVSKRVFFEPNYGVMRSSEPLQVGGNLLLEPLCLIGVSVENIPLKYTKYYHKNDPDLSLSEFLKCFWDRTYQVHGFNNPIISGMPELLIIDHRSKHLIHEAFYKWLTLNNIEYTFSDGKLRKAIAKFQRHQDYPHTGLWKDMTVENSYVADKENYALSLDELNYQENIHHVIFPAKKHLKNINEYSRNILKFRQSTSPIKQDIDLKMLTPLDSKADRQLDAAYWVYANLETGSFGYLHNRHQQDLIDSERHEKKAFLAAIKSLPETQWRDLFTSGQIDIINQIKKQRFKDTILVDEDNYSDMCFKLGLLPESELKSISFDVSKLSRVEMIDLWDQYSGGGDVQYSFEIILSPSQKCRGNLKYRFFYLSTDFSCDSSVFFLCNSDCPAAKAFDNNDCINYVHEQIYTHHISDKLNFNFFDEILLHTPTYLNHIAKEVKYYNRQKSQLNLASTP